ncbi:Ig-like domain-containing protein [Ochrobactrum sp. RH2CCR150]|uniref:Ig-like domain-containing protein n=1 Tax=Ochrobactrum sp. RH2CCR150 TaxID=2587044 RepID=UPI0015F79155|nr:hypothetical protein [Ochrobactrum sp. RH2CCR150]
MNKFILSQQNNILRFVSPTDDSGSVFPANQDVEFTVDYRDNSGKAMADRTLVWKVLVGEAIFDKQTTSTDDNGHSVNSINASLVDNSANRSVRIAVSPLDEPDAVLEFDCTFTIAETMNLSSRSRQITFAVPTPDTLKFNTELNVVAHISSDTSSTGLDWMLVEVSGPSNGTLSIKPYSSIQHYSGIQDALSYTTFHYNYDTPYSNIAVVLKVDAVPNGHDCVTTPVLMSFPDPRPDNYLFVTSPATGYLHVDRDIPISVVFQSNLGSPLRRFEIDWGKDQSGIEIKSFDPVTDEEGRATAVIRGKSEGRVVMNIQAPFGGPGAKCSFPMIFYTPVVDSITLITSDAADMPYDTKIPVRATVLDQFGLPCPDVEVNWYFGAPQIAHVPSSTSDPDGIATCTFSFSTQTGYPTPWASTTVAAKTHDTAVSSDLMTITFTGPSLFNFVEVIKPDQTDHTLTFAVGDEIDFQVKLTHDKEYPLANYKVGWDFNDLDFKLLHADPNTNDQGLANAKVTSSTAWPYQLDFKVPDAGPNVHCLCDFTVVERNDNPSSVKINPPAASAILYDTHVPISAIVKNSAGDPVPNATVNWKYEGQSQGLEYLEGSQSNDQGIAEGYFLLKTQDGYPGENFTIKVTASTDDDTVPPDSATLTFAGPSDKNKLEVRLPDENSRWLVGEDIHFQVRLTHNDEYPLAGYPITWFFDNESMYTKVSEDAQTNKNGIATAVVKAKQTGPREIPIYATPEAGASNTVYIFVDKHTLTINPPNPATILYDTDVPISATYLNYDGAPVEDALIGWDYFQDGKVVGGQSHVAETDQYGVASTTFRFKTAGLGYPGANVFWTAQAGDDSNSILSDEVKLTFRGPGKNNDLVLTSPADGSEWPVNKDIRVTVTLYDDLGNSMWEYGVKWKFTGSCDVIGTPDSKTAPLTGTASATIQGLAEGTIGIEVSAEDAGIVGKSFSLKLTNPDVPHLNIHLSALAAEDILYDTKIPIFATVTNDDDSAVPYTTLKWNFLYVPGLQYCPESTTSAEGVAEGWFMYSTTDGEPSALINTDVQATTLDGSSSSEKLTIHFVGSGKHNALILISPADGSVVYVEDKIPVTLKLTDWYGTKLSYYVITWDDIVGGATVTGADLLTDENGEAKATITGAAAGTVQFTAHAQEADADCPFTLSFHQRDKIPTITINPPASDTVLYDTIVPITAAVTYSDGSRASVTKIKWIFSDVSGLHSSTESIIDPDGVATGYFVYSTTEGYPEEWVTIDVHATTPDGSFSSNSIKIQFTGIGEHNALDLVSPENGETCAIDEEIPVKIKLTNQFKEPLKHYSISWDHPVSGAVIKNAETSTDTNGEARATITGIAQETVEFVAHAAEAGRDCSFNLIFQQQDKLPNIITIHPPLAQNIVYNTRVPISATVKDSKGDPAQFIDVHWGFTGGVTFSDTGQTDEKGEVTGWFSFSTEDGYPALPIVTEVTLSDEFGDNAEPITLVFAGSDLKEVLDLISPTDGSQIEINVDTTVTLKLTHDHQYVLRNYPISWDTPTNGATIQIIDHQTDDQGLARATVRGANTGIAHFYASIPHTSAERGFELEFIKQDVQGDHIIIDPPADGDMLYDSWVKVTASYLNGNGDGIADANLSWHCTNGVEPQKRNTTTGADGSSTNYIRFETLAGYPAVAKETYVNVAAGDGRNEGLKLTFTHSADTNHLTLIELADGGDLVVGMPTTITVRLTNQFDHPLTKYPVSWMEPVANATLTNMTFRTNDKGIATATIEATAQGSIQFGANVPEANAPCPITLTAVNRPDCTLIQDTNYAHNPPAGQQVDVTDPHQIVTFEFRYLHNNIAQQFREIGWVCDPLGMYARYYDYNDTELTPDENGRVYTTTGIDGISILKVGSVTRFLTTIQASPTGTNLPVQECRFVIASFDTEDFDDTLGSVTYLPDPLIIPAQISEDDRGFKLIVPDQSLENAEVNSIVFWVARYTPGKDPEEIVKIFQVESVTDGVYFPYTCIYPDEGQNHYNLMSYMVSSDTVAVTTTPKATRPKVKLEDQ